MGVYYERTALNREVLICVLQDVALILRITIGGCANWALWYMYVPVI